MTQRFFDALPLSDVEHGYHASTRLIRIADWACIEQVGELLVFPIQAYFGAAKCFSLQNFVNGKRPSAVAIAHISDLQPQHFIERLEKHIAFADFMEGVAGLNDPSLAVAH